MYQVDERERTVEVDERTAVARVGAALDGALQLRAEGTHQLHMVHVAQLCNTCGCVFGSHLSIGSRKFQLTYCNTIDF